MLLFRITKRRYERESKKYRGGERWRERGREEGEGGKVRESERFYKNNAL